MLKVTEYLPQRDRRHKRYHEQQIIGLLIHVWYPDQRIWLLEQLADECSCPGSGTDNCLFYHRNLYTIVKDKSNITHFIDN